MIETLVAVQIQGQDVRMLVPLQWVSGRITASQLRAFDRPPLTSAADEGSMEQFTLRQSAAA
jgi:hypothetical protein